MLHDVNATRLVRLIRLVLLTALLSLAAPPAEAQTNTQVRFRVSYGSTLLGNIDVELFDHDKPGTVSNFLAYVDSGRYKRTLFHRLVPGFVIQGGEWNIINPYSGALFQILNTLPRYPAVSNEYNVGTVRSNVFGTIAMAKVEGQPDSATSSWFFNLANNSVGNISTNLDIQNSGFTVFGQIIAGTNLLNIFNGLSQFNGIINTADLSYFLGCGTFVYVYQDGEYLQTETAASLPVSYRGAFCVRYADLLTVDVFRLTNGAPDTASPSMTLVTPKVNEIVSTTDVMVSGTSKDNGAVAAVDVILNHERLTVAAGAPNWSVAVTNVQPGTNTLTVVALDARGNQSKPAFRNFFKQVQTNLTVTISGVGTLTGPASGQIVDLNRNYLFVAKPGTGYVFNRWSGSFGYGGGARSSFNPTLYAYFLPNTNALVHAEFIENPFLPVKGTYNGLFHESGGATNDLAGGISLLLSDRGTYSGKVTVEGKTLPFKGVFANDGIGEVTVKRSGTNDLRLRFNLDVTNHTGVVTGLVTFPNAITARAASLTATLGGYNAKLNPAPLAGLYTIVLPGATGSSTIPSGHGYATAKIDASGNVTLAGALADGSKFSLKTALARSDTSPFFVSPYAGKGLALGWLSFPASNPATQIAGTIYWQKAAGAKGLYPAGFTTTSDVIGSRFTKPATPTTRIVDIPTGNILFSGGNLAAPFTNDVLIASNSSVTSTAHNNLKVSFNKATGLMTGSVLPTGSAITLKFSGVVLQEKSTGAYGYFPGPSESGRVVLLGP